MVGNNSNSITISTFGIVYLSSLVVVLFQHFSDISFGFVGFICWVIVIVGAIGFILSIINHFY
jgi:hypothetical protein